MFNPSRLVVGQPFFAECLKIMSVLSVVRSSSLQIQSRFDSLFGVRLARVNLNSNQIANIKDNLSEDNWW